jgi:uncharacterized repeat protein (TIGR01451 family)
MNLKPYALNLVLVVFSVLNLPAQFTECYFTDEEPKDMSRISGYTLDGDRIFISGTLFDQNLRQPAVYEIDTLGNILWRTTDQDNRAYERVDNAGGPIIKSGDHLFTRMVIDNGFKDRYELWKVDASNGDLLWRVEFEERIIRLRDYDEEKLLVYFYGDDFKEIAFINKDDGTIISSHLIGSTEFRGVGLTFDSDLNIYLTHRDTIFKRSHLNPDSSIMKIPISDIPEVSSLTSFYIDSNDSLFCFATSKTGSRGLVMALHSKDGSLHWQTEIRGDEFGATVFTDKGGYLYSAWEHRSVGSGSSRFHAAKVDKNTGALEWNTAYSFKLNNAPNGGNESGARSVGVDSQGGVYLTGYYADANYGPANWGILKLNGADGSPLYEQTVTQDTSNFDRHSGGQAVFFINDQPYFLGQLQMMPSSRTAGALVKLAPQTGQIVVQRIMEGNYTFTSRTVQIKKLESGNFLVLKQVGRRLAIELYDHNRDLIWEKYLTKDYKLIGDNLNTRNGRIVLTAYTIPEVDPSSFLAGKIESMDVFFLDLAGNVLNEYSFEVEENPNIPTNIIMDENDDTFIFWGRGGILCTKIAADSTVLFKDTRLPYDDETSNPGTVINQSDSTFLIIGKNINDNQIIEIKKRDLSTRTLFQYIGLNKVTHAAGFSDSTIIISGSGSVILDRPLFGNETIMKFNLNTQDYEWISQADNSRSYMRKFIYNADSSYLYSIGSIGRDAVVRKISTQDGAVAWNYTLDDPPFNIDDPLDIRLNPLTGHLTFIGYSFAIGRYLFADVIDTTGVRVGAFFNRSDFNNNIKKDLSFEILDDGGMILGGQVNLPEMDRVGFLFKSAPMDEINSVSGFTFYDENANGVKDTLERPLPFFRTSLRQLNTNQFSNANGAFTYLLGPGDYELTYDTVPNWRLSSDSAAYRFSLGVNEELTDLNFGFVPIDTIIEMVVGINSGYPRCDKLVDFELSTRNIGTTINSGTLWLKIDALVQNVELASPPDTMLGDTLFGWYFDGLYPNELFTERLAIEIPGVEDGIVIGDRLYFDAYAVVETDTFSASYRPEIFCAYDPNDKLVSPEKDGLSNYTLFDEWITYTIRFQNTGNDTAFTVVVRDTLDANLDLNSFQILNSSHLDILEASISGRSLEFAFPSIMLPDSSRHFDASQGFITYTIKAKKGLSENTPIRNSASIYFDQNPPIRTNTTLNTLVSMLPGATAVGEEKGFFNKVKVYPNPSKGFVNVELELHDMKNDIDIRVLDVLGRELRRWRFDDQLGRYFSRQLELGPSSGMRLIRVQVNEKVGTFKLVVE